MTYAGQGQIVEIPDEEAINVDSMQTSRSEAGAGLDKKNKFTITNAEKAGWYCFVWYCWLLQG